MKSSEQNIDGNDAVDWRDCLYLCEDMEVNISFIIVVINIENFGSI